MNRRFLFVGLLMLGSVATAAEQPLVTASIELPAAKLLPGVPFDALITVTNTAEYPVAVGRNAVVFAGAPGDLAAAPEQIRLACDAVADNAPNIELQPHESQTAFVSWTANWFARDATLTVPGTYDLQFELVGAPDAVSDGVVYAGRVRTGTARLVRVTPEGDDAVVWNRLREASNGNWPSRGFLAGRAGQDLATWVIEQHASSGYYPYALVLSHALPPLAKFETPTRFEGSPAYPHLLLRASMVAYTLGDLATKRAPADATRYFAAALAYSNDAIVANSVPVRSAARSIQEHATTGIEHLRVKPAK